MLKIHIDCNDRLKLQKGDKFFIKKGKPNWRLNNQLEYLDDLIKLFPVKEQKRMNQGLAPFINAMTSFDITNLNDLSKIISNWHPKNIEALGEDPEILINLNKLRTEAIFEQVRQKYFSSSISRLESIYLGNKPEDWIGLCEDSNMAVVYKFSVENATLEEYDSFWYTSSSILEYEEVEKNANNYWSKEISSAPKIEFLAIGELVVTEILC